MITVLIMILLAFLLKLCGFASLLGLSVANYYIMFTVFGMALHLVNVAGRHFKNE